VHEVDSGAAEAEGHAARLLHGGALALGEVHVLRDVALGQHGRLQRRAVLQHEQHAHLRERQRRAVGAGLRGRGCRRRRRCCAAGCGARRYGCRGRRDEDRDRGLRGRGRAVEEEPAGCGGGARVALFVRVFWSVRDQRIEARIERVCRYIVNGVGIRGSTALGGKVAEGNEGILGRTGGVGGGEE